MTDYAAQRETMVASQIRPNRITDSRLLKAMLNVPREAYLPQSLRVLAYMDGHVPLDGAFPQANGRFLLSPLVAAQLLQLARIQPGFKVLDLACGTGYSTAVLAALDAKAAGIEPAPDAAAFAKNALETQKTGASVRHGPIQAGFADGAPFDAIVINGAIGAPPESLFAQLREGGRLAVIVGRPFEMKAAAYENSGGQISIVESFGASAPQLVEFEMKTGFVFLT